MYILIQVYKNNNVFKIILIIVKNLNKNFKEILTITNIWTLLIIKKMVGNGKSNVNISKYISMFLVINYYSIYS